MRSKLLILTVLVGTLAMTGGAGVAYAQPESICECELRPYAWYVELGAGPIVYFGKNDKLMPFTERIQPSFFVSLGKQMRYGLSMELSATEGGFNGLVAPPYEGKLFAGDELYVSPIKPSYILYRQQGNYMNVLYKIKYDLLTLFDGESFRRKHELDILLGAGCTFSILDEMQVFSPSVAGGLEYQFDLGPRTSLELSWEIVSVDENFENEYCEKHIAHAYSNAGLSLIYHFR